MLALVGSGEYLAAIAEVDRQLLALFDSPPKVVRLPTAAGREGDRMIDSWMQRGVDHFAELGAESVGVRVWDRTSADDAELAAEIATADFVYLSGGKPSYLHDVLVDSRAWDAILAVVDRGGLLAGCSAGAMVQGEIFAGVPRGHEGFGLWPGVTVVPHFDEIPSAAVSAMRLLVGKHHTLVGVNANTALVNVGDTYRVIGDQVTVWTSDTKIEFGAGEIPCSAFEA